MKEYIDEINRMLNRFLTPAVKIILVVNVAMFLVKVLGASFSAAFGDWFDHFFGLTSFGVLKRFMLWQFVTYMFMHVDTMHLFFNMLTLWFFGPPLEERFGTRYFLRFYLLTGIGAGVLHILITTLFGLGGSFILGASGAIYGVMLAYALYYPETTVLLFMFYPIKIKYLMPLLALFAFLGSAGASGSRISHLTHLTGLIVAFALLVIRHRNWDVARWRWQG